MTWLERVEQDESESRREHGSRTTTDLLGGEARRDNADAESRQRQMNENFARAIERAKNEVRLLKKSIHGGRRTIAQAQPDSY